MKYSVLVLLSFATAVPAAAQNNMAPSAGLLGTGPAVVNTQRSVTFTALGTYADQGADRLIDVQTDRDNDGDDVNDKGILKVSCNGGDTLTGLFKLGGTVQQQKAKVQHASGSSPLGSGKTFKGSWNIRESTADGTPVIVGSDQPDLCVGRG
jgi:hypothetical protein